MPGGVGELVHRDLQRMDAVRGARRAHVDRAVLVERDDLVVQPHVVAGVELAGPVDDDLAVVLAARGLGDGLRASRPSAVPFASAASRTRCQVSGRWPKVNICWRVSTTRTDRFSCSAAIAASSRLYCGRRPEPKAPPTTGVLHRHLARRQPEGARHDPARVLRALRLVVDGQVTVVGATAPWWRASPSDCGARRRRSRRWSILTGAASNAASASPRGFGAAK